MIIKVRRVPEKSRKQSKAKQCWIPTKPPGTKCSNLNIPNRKACFVNVLFCVFAFFLMQLPSISKSSFPLFGDILFVAFNLSAERKYKGLAISRICCGVDYRVRTRINCS